MWQIVLSLSHIQQTRGAESSVETQWGSSEATMLFKNPAGDGDDLWPLTPMTSFTSLLECLSIVLQSKKEPSFYWFPLLYRMTAVNLDAWVDFCMVENREDTVHPRCFRLGNVEHFAEYTARVILSIQINLKSAFYFTHFVQQCDCLRVLELVSA